MRARRALTLLLLALGAGASLALACGSFAGGSSGSAEDAAIPSPDASPRDAASDATVEASTPDAAPTCKGGKDGRPAVRVTDSGCIDVKEVSVADYRVFLDAGATPPPAAGRCVNNLLAPDPGCNGVNAPSDSPRTCIDWCDAFAYCAWAGKRLCGAVGGGPVNPVDLGNPVHDEWHRACAGADGGRAYPYGNTYDASACATTETANVDVGTRPGCRTPEGVLDLTGNVAEWVDSCDNDNSVTDCRHRGGDYASAGQASCGLTFPLDRTATRYQVGFRCCSD